MKGVGYYTFQVILHGIFVACAIWLSGAATAYFTYETDSVHAHLLNAFVILWKWLSWLKENWSALDVSAYGYIKIKLCIAFSVPSIAGFALYSYYQDKIL